MFYICIFINIIFIYTNSEIYHQVSACVLFTQYCISVCKHHYTMHRGIFLLLSKCSSGPEVQKIRREGGGRFIYEELKWNFLALFGGGGKLLKTGVQGGMGAWEGQRGPHPPLPPPMMFVPMYVRVSESNFRIANTFTTLEYVFISFLDLHSCQTNISFHSALLHLE